MTRLALALLLMLFGCATAVENSSPQPKTAAHGSAQANEQNDVLGETTEESEGEETNQAENPDPVSMTLPMGVEGITIDRFLRDRRTLMVKFLPLEPVFRELHSVFAPRNVLSRDVEAALRQNVLANRQRSHWVFLHGALELQDTLSNASRPLLLEEQKSVIAHYGRTLLFVAKTLDSAEASKESGRYTAYFRQLYRMLSARYLFRDLKDRDSKRMPATVP